METEKKNIENKAVVEEYESPGQFKQKKKEEPTLKFSFGDLLKQRLTKTQ